MDGDVKGIRECVKMGADGNTPHNGGITHMHVSAHGGHVGAIKILVELGANVNTPNNSGAIPNNSGRSLDIVNGEVMKK